MSIPTDNSSEKMLELLDIYYEAGIWKKYNWYDFLEELVKIRSKRPSPRANPKK